MEQTGQVEQRKKRVIKTRGVRQREIVDATVELLHKYGVEGTSVSRIAEGVGMSKAALYYHFPNHEALLMAALESMDRVSAGWFTQSSGEDVHTRLLAMGRAHADWALSVERTFLRPLYQVISSSREGILISTVRAKKNHLFQLVVDCVEQGKRDGTVRADVDSREVAWCVFLFMWGEDVAALQGDNEFITGGVSQRLLGRLLAPYFVSSTSNGKADPGCWRLGMQEE